MKSTKIQSGTYRVVAHNGRVYIVECQYGAYVESRWCAYKEESVGVVPEYEDSTKAGVMELISKNNQK
ncbi:MAG: hypothetical protein ACXW1D_00490 [Halobacteriota archaeon]